MDAQEDVRAAAAAAASPSPTHEAAVPTDEAGGTTAPDTPNGIKSSPPVLNQDAKMALEPLNDGPGDPSTKSDSEAETIVLPGKDGHSPSKIRKSIKHEDKSDDDEMQDSSNVQSATLRADFAGVGAASLLGKRKRSKNGNNKDDGHYGNSSGLSSVPTSPVATARSSLSKAVASDSDISKSPSPAHSSSRVDKAKSVDRLLPRKRQYESGSGDEGPFESRRFARQRSSGADLKFSRDGRSVSKPITTRKDTRSISPPVRGHRRSISTQLPSKSPHGLGHKKKRVPAPLQSTEYHSDDSSVSNGSHPRSSRLRSLAATVTGDSTISPAKMAPHKKHLNPSGQTLLQRACAKSKLDVIIQRYDERPEDLNEPDHAGNTPLHVASIAGREDVVKYLLEKNGCVVDPVNSEEETPLHDAVENGFLEVVQLLLAAGANPTKPNRAGNEPLDLIKEKTRNSGDGDESGDDEDEEDSEMWHQMVEAIEEAKRKRTDVQRESEIDHTHDYGDNRLSHQTESPRNTPPVQGADHQNLAPASRRTGTSRSMKTQNRHLHQPLNVQELRKAARCGDVETTSRILDAMFNLDDAKALYNAARGGHVEVMNFLFGQGNFHPDPTPIEGKEPEYATPILAAIGRGNNLEIIRMFTGNPRFDPTRLTKGETYYQIAKRRAGPQAQEEEAILKDAYDNYKSPKSSPGSRRNRQEAARDSRRPARKEEEQIPRSHKRTTSNTKETDNGKPSHRANVSLIHAKDGQNPKRGPGRPRKEEISASTIIADGEASPLGPPKQKAQIKRSESDVPGTSESEITAKPRRKLVSGKEFRGERELEKQRRASVASNTSSVSVKEKRDRESPDTKPGKLDRRTSPSVSRNLKNSDHDLSSERQLSDKDRARSIKRDDSKDRLSAIRGESPVKRPRKSETPPRSSAPDTAVSHGSSGAPTKRRKLDMDAATGRKGGFTPSSSPERSLKAKSSLSTESSSATTQPHISTKQSPPSARNLVEYQKEPEKQSLASENFSHGRQANPSKSPVRETSSLPTKDRAPSVDREMEEAAKEKEAQRQNEEREAMRIKEEEKKREQDRLDQARILREKAAREEEATREQEEIERRERQRIADAEAYSKAQEARALYLEQEKQKKEEQERRRAAAHERERAERAKAEKERRAQELAKLPFLLRWLQEAEEPKTPEIASCFKNIIGYRYDTILPHIATEVNGREQWMLNTHVAVLLGERDLQLSRYTAWERVALTEPMKKGVWMIENEWFALRHSSLPLDLRKKYPVISQKPHEIIEQNETLFMALDLFFVKVSEFMFIVPNIPHLRGIEIKVSYSELSTPSLHGPKLAIKWSQDPGTPPSQIFAPEPKYYLNGELIRQGQTPITRLIDEPPSGDDRVPRRGLVRAYPGELDYEDLCRKQGLYHFLTGNPTSPSSTSNPQIGSSERRHEQTNGITPPSSDKSKSINGGSPT